MPPFLRTLLLTCCVSTAPTWMVHAAYPSGYYNVDPSSVVFPASLMSPFSTQNQIRNSGDVQAQYSHAVEALFAVTTRLKALLGLDTNKNLLVSPISTTTALAELLLGARGPSRLHLLNILTTVNRSSNNAEATVPEFHQHLGGLLKLLQSSSDYDDSYQLHLANALFLQRGLNLLSDFRNAVTDLYGVDVIPVDFSGDPLGSMNMINQWASAHTMGVINKVFSHPLPRTTAAVLTNAIYFKGDWEMPFNPRFTIPGKFMSNETHTVDVQFMRGQFDLMYVDNKRLGCRMIAIPYKHAKAAMFVILPDTGNLYDIREFAARLSVDDIRELITTTRLASVTLVMPKMKLTQNISIRKALSQFQNQAQSKLGDNILKSGTIPNTRLRGSEGSVPPRMCYCPQYGQTRWHSSTQDANIQNANAQDANIQNPNAQYANIKNPNAQDANIQNPNAQDENKQVPEQNYAEPWVEDRFVLDLSGASPDNRFQVDDIVHHIFLEISEVGTVAAAVGSTTVDYIGEFRNFIMDRPFLFFIRHEITGTPVLWGTIVDPTNDDT